MIQMVFEREETTLPFGFQKLSPTSPNNCYTSTKPVIFFSCYFLDCRVPNCLTIFEFCFDIYLWYVSCEVLFLVLYFIDWPE